MPLPLYSGENPPLVETVLNHSAAACPHAGETSAKYAARLKPVLENTWSNDLDQVIAHNVAVCLDPRLDAQTDNAWNHTIYGVFYNQARPSVSVWNDGTYASAVVGKLGDALRDNATLQGEFWYAGRYRSGKTRKMRLKSEGDFDQDSIAANPQLRTSLLLPSAP